MSSSLVLVIVVGGAGASTLVVFVGFVLWICLSQKSNVLEPLEQSLGTRCFTLAKLSCATRSFCDHNFIGIGKFGEVYMGLLHDGTLVAIKKRFGAATWEFIDKARYLASIEHRNLVTLLGYCQEENLQLLVYEYVLNGSLSVHLYRNGPGQVSREKLEFKKSLSIALAAAKGLAHLHSLSPLLIHKDFKTANVLVDQNFNAKVADAGIHHFVGRHEAVGPSSQVADEEIFLAPEVREFKRYSEKSDVYSFGVFLLELISGRKATESPSLNNDQNLVEWDSENWSDVKVLIDPRLQNTFTNEGMANFMQLMLQCIAPSSERRPSMSDVVSALDRILEGEMHLTSMMVGEGPVVTPGSQLFRATK